MVKENGYEFGIDGVGFSRGHNPDPSDISSHLYGINGKQRWGVLSTLIIAGATIAAQCGGPGGDDPNLVIQQNESNRLNRANSTAAAQVQINIEMTHTAATQQVEDAILQIGQATPQTP